MDSRKILLVCTLAFSIILEWWVRATDQWWRFGGHMDNLMHFCWGLNIFLILVIIFKLRPLLAFYCVFAWQMFWELMEMIGDQIISQPASMLDIFWWDGIKDTVVDLLGAALGWFILYWIPKGLDDLRDIEYSSAFYVLPMLMIPGFALGAAVWTDTGVSPQALAIIWIVASLIFAATHGIATERKKMLRAK